jgi:hypothetical protein
MRAMNAMRRSSHSTNTDGKIARVHVGNAHGQGLAAGGPGHTSPNPAPTTAPQEGSIEDEVHLQDGALAPTAAWPPAAAYLNIHERLIVGRKLPVTGLIVGAKSPLPLSTTALRQEGIEDRV